MGLSEEFGVNLVHAVWRNLRSMRCYVPIFLLQNLRQMEKLLETALDL